MTPNILSFDRRIYFKIENKTAQPLSHAQMEATLHYPSLIGWTLYHFLIPYVIFYLPWTINIIISLSLS
eukprot:c44515_g1_i1 orf=1-204(-)